MFLIFVIITFFSSHSVSYNHTLKHSMLMYELKYQKTTLNVKHETVPQECYEDSELNQRRGFYVVHQWLRTFRRRWHRHRGLRREMQLKWVQGMNTATTVPPPPSDAAPPFLLRSNFLQPLIFCFYNLVGVVLFFVMRFSQLIKSINTEAGASPSERD